MNVRVFLVAVFAAGLSGPVPASATTFVETFDGYPQGPVNFVDATPDPQTIDDGWATFTNGVIVSIPPTFLPPIPDETSPNWYGSANFVGLPNDVSIAIDASKTVDEVSFVLVNGETGPVSYEVDAYDGATLVASQTFSDLPDNSDPDNYALPDLLSAGGITDVHIYATGPDASFEHDFEIDTVAFNGSSVQQAVVPEPSTWAMTLAGFAGLGWLAHARRRKLRPG
jgi:hypothetical protein